MSAEKVSNTSVKKIGYKDIFHQKEYMKMVIASIINRFGDSIDAIAFTWVVYEITQNAAWSAIIFGLNRVPSVLVTPFAGAWVEGRNKKRIMVVTDIIRAICVAVVATGYLFGFLRPWMLVLTTLVISTAEAFRGPANTALTPRILEKQYYEYGMSLMSTLSSVAELIGTAIAAGLIALIGSAGAIYVDMATFVLSAFIIMLVNSKEQKTEKQKFDVKEYTETFRDGLAYVKSDKLALFLCGFAIFLNAILVPFNSLQAPLTEEILGGGAEVLSILGVGLTIGMIAGSILYPSIRKGLSAKTTVFVGGMGMGLYYLSLILCTPLYTNKWFMYIFVAIASGLFGFLITLTSSFMNVEVVKRIDEKYLARAFSILSASSSASMPITAFIISAVAVFVKTEWIFIVAGVIDIIIVLFMLRSKVLSEEYDKRPQSVVAEAE